jgi:peptide deformylase
LKIFTYLETNLTNPALPIDNFPIELRIIEKMIYLVRKNKGLGLAAPQVGIPRRFFVLNRIGQAVIVNPVIDATGGDPVLGHEGCLSFPWIDVEIPRFPIVRLKFQDERGKALEETFTGLPARTVQHELEHLNGGGIWDYLR